MKPYFFRDGIVELSQVLRGTENIYMGIRPYGFHTGNMCTLVAYPILLCSELKRINKIPKFTFHVFINDWEQDKLDGLDVEKYPYNILPKFTTWQYVKDPIDKKRSIVDVWEKVISAHTKLIEFYFPDTKVKIIRNSSMKMNPIMKKCLIKTIRNPAKVLQIIKKGSNKPTLKDAIFASAVCPKCNAARGVTRVKLEDHIVHNCINCKTKSRGEYGNFDYWFYHKPLSLPRIEIYKIDLTITNINKYKEGNFTIRKELMKQYGMKMPPPNTLYAPVILGANKKTMGKSKGNAFNIGLDQLLQLLNENPNSEEIIIPNSL